MLSKQKPVPNRAETIAEKEAVMTRLRELWLRNPDLRLAQLIGNVYPCGPHPDHHDPYYVEDFDFITHLEMRYEE